MRQDDFVGRLRRVQHAGFVEDRAAVLNRPHALIGGLVAPVRLPAARRRLARPARRGLDEEQRVIAVALELAVVEFLRLLQRLHHLVPRFGHTAAAQRHQAQVLLRQHGLTTTSCLPRLLQLILVNPLRRIQVAQVALHDAQPEEGVQLLDQIGQLFGYLR